MERLINFMCNIFDHKSGDVTAYNNLESCLETTLTDLYLKLQKYAGELTNFSNLVTK